MGSPYKVSKVNKERANKIARKWINRNQKGLRIDDFIAQEVMGQGFTGMKNYIKAVITSAGVAIETKLSKKLKPTFGKKKTKSGGKINKKKK